MTNDRVSTLEHVYDEWARGNFRAGQDLLSDEVEYQIDYPHGPQTYVGREGVATYMREILREWAHMQVEAEEIVEIGDHVFVAQRQVQTEQLSGVRVEEHTAAVWTFSGLRTSYATSTFPSAQSRFQPRNHRQPRATVAQR